MRRKEGGNVKTERRKNDMMNELPELEIKWLQSQFISNKVSIYDPDRYLRTTTTYIRTVTKDEV